MRVHTYYILIIPFILCLLSCGGKKTDQQEETKLDLTAPVSIEIKAADINKEKGVQGVISCVSYIPLSDEVLLSNINRVLVSGDYIYILDRSPKIVCFNKKGKAIYSIDQKGTGPKEFANLRDFTLDKENGLLVAYDNGKRRLSYYDIKTGAYLYDKPITFLAPKNICLTPEGFYFHTPEHYNYANEKEKHFFLFYSKSGEKIDSSFLPHDAIADYAFGLGDPHPFFYSDDNILYNKPFDNRVYLLENGGITPFANISLPNFLPMEKIEDKMDPVTLSHSDYSFGISDLYIIDNVLHFSFSKEGYIQTVFFDLEQGRLLYCGARVSGVPTKELPLYSIISGASGQHFFSIVSPEQIFERQESHPELLPEQLKNLAEDANPVLVFYKINK